MKSSSFNKKKWLKNHLDKILELKSKSLTLQAIIEHLRTCENMPFDLTESLLSRYLKEFANDNASTLKTETALKNKLERQKERLTSQNNEIQNLSRRLERIVERNEDLLIENKEIKERNRLLENKFLDGEARLKDLRRYNGYNNVHWKVADLTEKNDEMFQSILMLERLSERLAEPHDAATETIEELTKANKQLESDLDQIKRKNKILEQENYEIEILQATIDQLHSEKELSLELNRVEPVIYQDKEKIEELSRERQEFLQQRNQLQMLSKRLKSDLSNSDYKLRETIHELYESQNNVKYKEIWRNLAIILAIITLILFYLWI